MRRVFGLRSEACEEVMSASDGGVLSLMKYDRVMIGFGHGIPEDGQDLLGCLCAWVSRNRLRDRSDVPARSRALEQVEALFPQDWRRGSRAR